MSTRLSLEASKKIFELVGDYETEVCWNEDEHGWTLQDTNELNSLPSLGAYPAPSFSELVRVMQKIGVKMNITIANRLREMACLYAYYKEEPEGMAAVEKYLDEILK